MPAPASATKAILTPNKTGLKEDAEKLEQIAQIKEAIKSPIKPIQSLKPIPLLAGVSSAPCAPFLGGNCERGAACPYSHDREQIFGTGGTSALSNPSPQVAPRKNKRQFKDVENQPPKNENVAKNSDVTNKDSNEDRSPAKRARIFQMVEEMSQPSYDYDEGEYYGYSEEAFEVWEDDYSGYEAYGGDYYGYGYDDSWDFSSGEYSEYWSEEAY